MTEEETKSVEETMRDIRRQTRKKYSAEEKVRIVLESLRKKSEIIHIVEHSGLPVKKTLDELQVPRSTFYRWYNLYQEDGLEGLIDHRPNPRQIWNRIPQEVKQQVVELALQHPDRSPMKKAISSQNPAHTASSRALTWWKAQPSR